MSLVKHGNISSMQDEMAHPKLVNMDERRLYMSRFEIVATMLIVFVTTIVVAAVL